MGIRNSLKDIFAPDPFRRMALSGWVAWDAEAVLKVLRARMPYQDEANELEYVGVAILAAMYAVTWIGVRRNMVSQVKEAMSTLETPLFTTLSIMLGLTNILVLSFATFMILGLIDMTLVDMLWWQGDRLKNTSAFPSENSSKLAFSWFFSARVLVSVAIAMGMTAIMCFVVLSRMVMQIKPPTQRDIDDAVTAVMTFNIACIAVCLTLQFVLQSQWDTCSRDAAVQGLL